MIKRTKIRMISADSISELEDKLNGFCKNKVIKSIQYQVYNDSRTCKHVAMVLYEIMLL